MPKILDLRKKQKEDAKTPPPKKTLKRVLPSLPPKLPAANNLTARQIPVQIAWEAPSFYFNPQKRYLSLVIIALALGGGGMLFFKSDTLTAIFLLLSSLVLVLYSQKRPEISKIMADNRGITIGEIEYYYKDIKSFWIHYNPGDIKELSLELRKWYMPYVKVSIEKKNPLLIRSLLINFLPEKEHEHSLVDIIARRIGL